MAKLRSRYEYKLEIIEYEATHGSSTAILRLYSGDVSRLKKDGFYLKVLDNANPNVYLISFEFPELLNDTLAIAYIQCNGEMPSGLNYAQRLYLTSKRAHFIDAAN